MIVEDNSLMRLSLALALVQDDVEIISAINGIDGLLLFHDYDGKFDAILTDNEMPKMAGLEFVEAIRKEGYSGRIVVMSGGMTPTRLKEFQEYSIDAFLAKPFVMGDIIVAMKTTGRTDKIDISLLS
jgi:CheY-like chemotaxis protein